MIRVLPHDPGSGMAGVLALAFVFDESDSKTLLRVGKMRIELTGTLNCLLQ